MILIPFAGDMHIKEKINTLVNEHEIKTIIETGTNQGASTIALSEMADMVYTIEINEVVWGKNQHLRKMKNVIALCGNSPDVLDEILSEVKQPVLFYLDAHWKDYWPLRDELKAIINSKMKNPVICIHDFKVPGKNFGYDEYNGRVLDFSYIEDLLPLVYLNSFDYCYNSEVMGDRRGIIYIWSKK